jgi:hypothetical protein
MEVLWVTLLIAPSLLIVVLAFLALLVVAIRRGDRASLRKSSTSRTEALARRALGVGVRNATDNDRDR